MLLIQYSVIIFVWQANFELTIKNFQIKISNMTETTLPVVCAAKILLLSHKQSTKWVFFCMNKKNFCL